MLMTIGFLIQQMKIDKLLTITSDGDWVLFLNTFLKVMLEEEDYENACHVRDTLLKFQRGATDKVDSSNFPY